MCEKPTHHDFEEVISMLRRLRSKRFYGTIQIGLQAGEVTSIKPTPELKPGDKLEC
jgi:hypothetical protein